MPVLPGKQSQNLIRVSAACVLPQGHIGALSHPTSLQLIQHRIDALGMALTVALCPLELWSLLRTDHRQQNLMAGETSTLSADVQTTKTGKGRAENALSATPPPDSCLPQHCGSDGLRQSASVRSGFADR